MKRLILILFLISTSYVFSQSKLPKCQGTDYKKYDNCFSEYIFPSGAKYIGEWKGGKFHGKGTVNSADGAVHVGEFEYGKRNGKGKTVNKDGIFLFK